MILMISSHENSIILIIISYFKKNYKIYHTYYRYWPPTTYCVEQSTYYQGLKNLKKNRENYNLPIYGLAEI